MIGRTFCMSLWKQTSQIFACQLSQAAAIRRSVFHSFPPRKTLWFLRAASSPHYSLNNAGCFCKTKTDWKHFRFDLSKIDEWDLRNEVFAILLHYSVIMVSLCFWFCGWTVPLIASVSSPHLPTVFLFVFFLTGHRTADDLHPVPGCLHQSAVWQSIRDGCSEINVFPGVSDVSVALPAADWSQTSLHPQPAVLPGAHTDQVIPQKLFWQNFLNTRKP